MPTEGKAVRTCELHSPYGAGRRIGLAPQHGVCSLLPGGTVAGDMARGAAVVAAGGWDGKQPGGRGYKSVRN